MLVKKNTLSDEIIIKLASVFKEHNWAIKESNSREYSLFDMFCERLEELENDSDRELMIELTQNYLLVELAEYEKYMTDVFRKFSESSKDYLKDIDVLHIFPVQDKNYPEKTKSGNLMCYLYQGLVMRKFREFHDKRVRIIETFEGLEQYKDDIKCLLVVDDYVGSGDTLLGCLNLIEEKGISKDIIKVLTLVVQQYGQHVVEDYGVDVFYSILRNKAITDNYSVEEAREKIAQMKGISKKIKVKEKNLYLGYKESEALVSMIRTPNNTFPFFWYECKKDGEITIAPFARRNNVGVDECI